MKIEMFKNIFLIVMKIKMIRNIFIFLILMKIKMIRNIFKYLMKIEFNNFNEN